jgi:hypothetical protein
MKLKSLIILFIVQCFVNINAQELKYLPGAPNLPIQASCVDSVGNLYTLLKNNNSRGLIYKYNLNTKIWTRLLQMDSVLFASEYSSTCIFLYGDLYVTGQYENNVNIVKVIKIPKNDTTQTDIQTIVLPVNSSSTARLQVKKFKNKLYYTGDYLRTSSFPNNTNYLLNPLVYNGKSFTNQYDLRSNKLEFDFFLDSLRFIDNNNAILTFNTSDTSRIVFFQDKFSINHLLSQDTNLYFTRNNGTSMELVKMGDSKNQSTLTLNSDINRFKLYNSNNGKMQLYLSNFQSQYNFTEFSGINNNLQYVRHFRILGGDTFPIQVVKGNNADYIYHPKGLIKNGINYGYIAQLEYDSFKNVQIDSLLIFTYRDNNKNRVYDIGDILVPCYIHEAVTNREFQSDNKGILMYASYDNEEVNFSVIGETNSSSCFAQPFSGGLSSKASFSDKNRDTLYIPLWDQSNDSINYHFNKFYSKQARIDDVIPIELNIKNKVCNSNKDTVFIDVFFDDSLKVIASSVMPFSIKGNHYRFRTEPSTGFSNNLKFDVKYPFGTYQLGEKVTHKIQYQFKKGTISKTLKDSIVQLMVYSYDPNIKTSEPAGRVKDGVKIINYFIHFQNEGNADAFRVRVVDTLNLKMPIYQFKMLGSSHPFKLSHYDNIVTWTFDNINLKPKSIDESASRGYVAFQAYLRNDLAVGDSIINSAAIFFDLNEPVITKESVIKRYDDSSSIFGTTLVKGLKVYPNPGGELLLIENLSSFNQDVKIYNSVGQLIRSEQIKAKEVFRIDTEYWSSGVYLLVNDSQTVLKWIKL